MFLTEAGLDIYVKALQTITPPGAYELTMFPVTPNGFWTHGLLECVPSGRQSYTPVLLCIQVTADTWVSGVRE